MRRTSLAIATAAATTAACLAASAASAQSLHEWDGLYAGGNLGLAFGETRDEGMRSLHVGRDWSNGHMVWGTELQWTDTGIEVPGGDLGDLVSLKLRFGQSTGDVLWYGIAGLSYASGSFGDDLGWMVGVGVDVKVYGPFTVGGELTHHEFNDFEGGGGSLGLNAITARISYHF